MKRQMLLATLFVLLPIAAAAQQVPPVPPVPPVPKVAPIPPVPPIPPMPLIDTIAVEDALRAAREKMQTIDFDDAKLRDVIARAASEQTLAMADQARAMAEQSKQLTEESFAYAFQDRPGFISTFTTSRSGDANYSSGLSLEDSKHYEKAIASFDQVVAQKGTRADAALYHKAFCQYRLGKTDDALVTIGELRKSYAQSRYLNDAKVLEADVKKQAGHPVRPEDATDDDIKLLAIQGIQNSDPVRAIPLLQGVLASNSAPAVKKRALYVLALSDQPEAHKILLDYAKGSGNPDLQRQAISYLASSGISFGVGVGNGVSVSNGVSVGISGGVVTSVNSRKQATSEELRQIYDSTQDEDVRLTIINAMRSSGDTANLIRLAGMDATPITIRQQAIGGLNATDLWSLYQKEQNHDLKLQMISRFGSMGAIDQLTQLAKAEKDPALRQRAIRSLGNMKGDKSGALLVEIYGSDADKDTRKAVISALESQNNADGLVGIARKETDNTLKLEIVRRLVSMAGHSKAAADYLMEIIK